MTAGTRPRVFISRQISAEALERLVCPIGSKAIVSKFPAIIAATVVVQLLEWQQMLKTEEIPLSAPQHLVKVAK